MLEVDNPLLDPSLERMKTVIPDLLISGITGRGQFTILERALINKVTSELALQASGKISDEQALRVGSLSGANVLIAGRVFSLDARSARVEARLIAVETGEVIAALTATGNKVHPVPLAAALSLQFLSIVGSRLDASERLYVELLSPRRTDASGPQAASASGEADSPPYGEGDNLFWRRFGHEPMNRVDDLQGVALLVNQDSLWPEPASSDYESTLRDSVASGFEEAFARQIRQGGLIGVTPMRSLADIDSNPSRYLLVPRTRSVSEGWNCPLYAFLQCRIILPRRFAEARGKLALLDFDRHIYWESSEAVGTGTAPTSQGALREAFSDLAWKWADAVLRSKLLVGANSRKGGGQ